MIKTLQIALAILLLQIMVSAPGYAAPSGGGEPGSGPPGGGDCASGMVNHTVRPGETIYSIARQYGVNPQTIIRANGLSNPDHIYVGQVLYITCSDGHGWAPTPKPKPDYGHKPGYGYQYPTVGYGYDFTGYYYEYYYPIYRRYSYTCGYHYNCY
ncbi:MAG: LysM domain-containing protein [Anaerolineae bacterium]|nr:LysM domain-containing protein [Anaerolineae bacterium]